MPLDSLEREVAKLRQELASKGSHVSEVDQLRAEVKSLKNVIAAGGNVSGVNWQKSWAEALPEAPPDAIFGLASRYKSDPSPTKVDLVVGAYRTEEGLPYLLPSVAEAERRLASARQHKEYAPILGLEPFRNASAAFVLGKDSPALNEGRVATCQSLSGTGALSIVASLYSRYVPMETQVLLSNPTWANHKQIFTHVGFRNFVNYQYWDPLNKGFNYEGMIHDLVSAPQRSIIVLHLCAHNPTGCDPTIDQWREIGKVCWERRHHVVFDSAYQGYATGDLERDAWPARLFEREIGLEFCITQSYSKNMGLYGERIGCFNYVCKTKTSCEGIEGQVKTIVRRLYSNPPVHGARLVTTILTDPVLCQQWERELKAMSKRIIKMRSELRNELEALGVPGPWKHITDQIGMFSFTGLTKEQVKVMTEEFHVYMLPSGRVSMAGLSGNNIKYVANAIKVAIEKHPAKRPLAAPTPQGVADATEEMQQRLDPFRLPSPLGQWTQLPTKRTPDAVFGALELYKRDPSPEKINLVLVADGRTVDSKPTLLNSVAQAEHRLAEARGQKEYMPIDGSADFRVASAGLILGEDSPALREGRVATCQSISGTGALGLIASFYSKFLPIETTVLLSTPTWCNHKDLFDFAGFRNFYHHRYWDPVRMAFDFKGMIEDLRKAPHRSIIILQLCAHNPTGCDPTQEQWREIGQVCWEKRHYVVLDAAYQGYATGDLERDAWPARLFEREIGLEFCITQSYSKPLGLYSERIGCLSYVCKSARAARAIQAQIKVIVRRVYSNPPLHGARIVTTILNDPALKALWVKELRAMSDRVNNLRGTLIGELEALETPGDWSYLRNTIGMFSLTGLTPAQVDELRQKHHIYLLRNGRMSWPGLTSKTVSKVAAAIDDVVKKVAVASKL
eukprot:TRINITY_DN442_c0_g2_i1.p1 TRINITY_DN442_c0_g2~~TRINITY_DN442_c0_g2_i1.p1  ORF type:complete len:905 (+),score=248.69 TRINITY_DN442_c0_g2_i1:67-2781(+)